MGRLSTWVNSRAVSFASGSVRALSPLSEIFKPSSHTQAHKHIVQAMKEVAATLGNQRATARKYYVHPAILDAYAEGGLD